MRSPPFDRDLLRGPTLEAVNAVLGARLVREGGARGEARVGRIVEVEAYVGLEDLASHAHRGRTRRNAVMFGPPGRAYVYLVYGMYHCLNIVTEPEGVPAALLVRGVQPLAGVDGMRRARVEAASRRAGPRPPGGPAGSGPAAGVAAIKRRLTTMPADRLAAGPGLVCAAFSIGRSDDGTDLCDVGASLRLEPPGAGPGFEIASGPRVGVDYAPEPWLSRPWRFWIAGNPAVSRGAGTTRPRPAATAGSAPGATDVTA